MSHTTIWKFPLAPLDVFQLRMPSIRENIVVDIDRKDGDPKLWAIVDPHSEESRVTFHVVGTGNPVPDAPTKYVGSWQKDDFVWHLFEVIE